MLRLGLDALIAFAGAMLEALYVQQSNMATPVSDQSGLLQRARHERQARSSYTQHSSEEILRHGEFIAAGEVPHPQ
jgi:hypothetical protein